MKLKDQVAIVTGAGRNIGEEIAKLFAAEGAKVAVVDLDRPRGQRVADAIKAAGGDAELFVDRRLARAPTWRRWSRRWSARFGRIDILVNNVAISDNKTHLRHHRGGLGPGDGGHAQEPVPDGQARRASRWSRRAPAARIVNIGSTSGFMGRSRRHRLFGRQGRRGEPHARHGGAARAAQHPGERDRAEQDRLARRQGRVRSDASGAEHGASARASRRKRRRRCCSW